MKNYTLLLLALLGFTSACNNNLPNTKNESIKVVSFNSDSNTNFNLKEGPNTTGTLKEGPNTTGTLKEGPNTTGTLKEGPNTTGSLKVTEKFILLAQQGENYDYPVTPELIKDIDIVYLKSKISLNPKGIRLKGQESFNILSDNEFTTAEYDGNGGFKFRIISSNDDMLVKFRMIDGTQLTIPLINDENRVKAVINKDKKDSLAKAKSIDSEQAYIIKNESNSQQSIISIDKDNNKEYYLAEDLENKVSNGYKKYSLNEIKTNNSEKMSIISGIKEISPISRFIGAWTHRFKDYRMFLHIFDQGNNKFLWIISLDNVIYQGYGNYDNSNNENLRIYSVINDKKIDIKVNSVNNNILNIVSEDNNEQIIKALNINLRRAIL